MAEGSETALLCACCAVSPIARCEYNISEWGSRCEYSAFWAKGVLKVFWTIFAWFSFRRSRIFWYLIFMVPARSSRIFFWDKTSFETWGNVAIRSYWSFSLGSNQIFPVIRGSRFLGGCIFSMGIVCFFYKKIKYFQIFLYLKIFFAF